MSLNRVIEYAFFILLLAGVGFLVWRVLSPFVSALALSIIIVTICYPLYEKLQKMVYKNSESLAAALATLIVVIAVILPILFISSVFVKELVGFYQTLGAGQEVAFESYLGDFETLIQTHLPDFEFNFTEQIKQSAEWLLGNVSNIFAGTISTIFVVLISLIGSFYFFRDGKQFVELAIKISPLPDGDDQVIFSRLALAIRSVATGVLLVSIIQGTLAAVGFAIFGIPKAVLWGAVGGILSMIPGVGTLAIMIPGIIYLFVVSTAGSAIGLMIWSIITIIVVDNMIGPQLMSRGNNLHPFIMLTSVLGGISTFGPIGFIIGPVILTLFVVLLEVYNQYIQRARLLKD
ncbi:MAG TPA: AI-2E family transporter [Candidatus Paceibacterota bacterium]|nr:AI-2E family transporter [Candidatus Paceibacterota bacterium]HMO83252.1 AI-2E family transporter [Candidatus Paceibacterota bacterium]